MNKKLTVGYLYGDATGIGPEISAKALSDPEIRKLAKFIVVGDKRVLDYGIKIANVDLEYKVAEKFEDIDDTCDVWVLDQKNTNLDELSIGEVCAKSGKLSGENLIKAIDLAKEGKVDSVVYASMNKDALFKGGFEFKDDITLLKDLFNHEGEYGEINVLDGKWYTRVTSHIPVSKIAEEITKEAVLSKIHFAYENLKNAGIENPYIAVCGLNPHSGDNGLLGMEEIEEISPAIEEAKKEGINIVGPYPADTIFLRLKHENYDCILSMYHDQGQIGMKLLGFERGVTIAGGLPVIITTPAHGTAFEIVGKGIANPGALKEAIKLNVKMTSERMSK